MEIKRKDTKTLVTLTTKEKEKAAKISIKLFGERNYSGLYAYFINSFKLEE